MATPAYPSFDAITPKPRPTEAFDRIYMTLRDVPGPAIYILDDPKQLCGCGPRQPYDKASPAWNQVAKAPLTEPMISSIEVTIVELDDRGIYWCIEHECDGEYDSDLADEWPGKPPPDAPPSLIIMASTEPYVTVDDFVSQVHPWLMGLRGEILEAMWAAEYPPDKGGPPANTTFTVSVILPSMMHFVETEWKRDFQMNGSCTHNSVTD